jgi:hypothetical protein
MSKKRLIVLACVVPVVVIVVAGVGCVVWWQGKYADQARVDRPVADLLLSTTGQPGMWSLVAEGPTPSEAPWITEEAGRNWKRSDGGRLVEGAYKFATPAWADWSFHRWNPANPKPWKGAYSATYRMPREFPQADDVRYTCTAIINPTLCDSWQVSLRYGQYIVLVQADDVDLFTTGGDRDIPDWLYAVVRDADRVANNRAPR